MKLTNLSARNIPLGLPPVRSSYQKVIQPIYNKESKIPFDKQSFSVASTFNKVAKAPLYLRQDLTNAFKQIDLTRFGNHIPVIVIGGTNFYNTRVSEQFCEKLASSLPSLPVIVRTGGMEGVGETIARNFDSAGNTKDRLFNFYPHEKEKDVEGIPDKPWPFGKDIQLGKNWAERREGLANLGRIFIMVEGGPGTADEAQKAHANGGIVIPIISSGGAASGMRFGSGRSFFDPNQASARLIQSGLITPQERKTLWSSSSIDNLANLTSKIINGVASWSSIT